MKTTTSLALGILASPLVQAHYIFSQVIHNGQAVGGDYTYIRKNSNTYMPSFTNDVVNSPNLRCNSGATAGSAKTLEVAAGDKVGFKLWFNENIEHPGPGFVYMSRAPNDDVNTYDGSGEWFKAFETGLCGGSANQDTAWCTWQKDRIEYTIPKDIPSGEYLVRVEHIAIHESHVGKAQFYMECAQLKITGGGNGTPGPLAKIPGIYTANDAGIAYNKWTSNPAPYVMPGPKVWAAGSSSSGGGGASNSAPATEAAPSNPQASSAPATGAPASGGGAAGGAALWAQCGGSGFTGASTCAKGTCKVVNPYYSQCQ